MNIDNLNIAPLFTRSYLVVCIAMHVVSLVLFYTSVASHLEAANHH